MCTLHESGVDSDRYLAIAENLSSIVDSSFDVNLMVGKELYGVQIELKQSFRAQRTIAADAFDVDLLRD